MRVLWASQCLVVITHKHTISSFKALRTCSFSPDTSLHQAGSPPSSFYANMPRTQRERLGKQDLNLSPSGLSVYTEMPTSRCVPKSRFQTLFSPQSLIRKRCMCVDG